MVCFNFIKNRNFIAEKYSQYSAFMFFHSSLLPPRFFSQNVKNVYLKSIKRPLYFMVVSIIMDAGYGRFVANRSSTAPIFRFFAENPLRFAAHRQTRTFQDVCPSGQISAPSLPSGSPAVRVIGPCGKGKPTASRQRQALPTSLFVNPSPAEK
jgi:hypothetical protein